ncbi:MAG: cupin domain-containing protein [Acidimicrobiales bacterium]|nr:cupin domain-containing protein [Acidimicrobiales bacterium]MYG87470.1 cupin domain-containing protein [Acidimicrobiales bacterium]MYI29224.1 cupin domain-containing protein [Acidimicrobiales bacterium]
MTEDEFRSELVARGYGEPRSYEFEPDADGELHSHEFSAMAMVTEGEFRLGLTDETRLMGVGDWCEVSAGTLHSEMAGPVGATLLVGTK